MMHDSVPELSLVVPVLNEADNVAALSIEIARALDGALVRWECVWVDDASTDGTSAALGRARAADPRHRPVRLAHPCGQSAALWVGFQHARADVLATMDGDGQNDPEDLARMYRELAGTGVDMVVGIRRARHDPRLRLWSARVAAFARKVVLGDTLLDAASPMRVFRRLCLRRVYPFKGLHRFLAILAHLDGCRIGQMPVAHRPRTTGVSKYGVGNRLGVGLVDLAAVAWMRRRGLRIDPRDVLGNVTGAESPPRVER
ncbi:MAG: glycosyltransferase [Acidobacteria bacterium]|nr:glycosyltransferase [Acidobacteriota bacterium]